MDIDDPRPYAYCIKSLEWEEEGYAQVKREALQQLIATFYGMFRDFDAGDIDMSREEAEEYIEEEFGLLV